MILTTGVFTIHRTGQPDTASVRGHATYRGGAERLRPDQRRQQVGAWALALDMTAWPVTELDTISDDLGNQYQVHAAARRPGLSPDLAHVVVDCDTITRDTDDGTTVDDEGNALQVVS